MSQVPVYAKLAIPALLLSAAVAAGQMLGGEEPPVQTAGESSMCAGVRCVSGEGR